MHKAIWKYNGQVTKIAVKSLKLACYDSENVRKAFNRELETLKKLNSPFVVRFIGERQKNKSNETYVLFTF